MQGESFWFLVFVIFLNVDTTIKHAILSYQSGRDRIFYLPIAYHQLKSSVSCIF